MLRRMTVPSTFGVMPMSDFMMAFSMGCRALRSHGWMTTVVDSGTLMLASWLRGVDVP